MVGMTSLLPILLPIMRDAGLCALSRVPFDSSLRVPLSCLTRYAKHFDAVVVPTTEPMVIRRVMDQTGLLVIPSVGLATEPKWFPEKGIPGVPGSLGFGQPVYPPFDRPPKDVPGLNWMRKHLRAFPHVVLNNAVYETPALQMQLVPTLRALHDFAPELRGKWGVAPYTFQVEKCLDSYRASAMVEALARPSLVLFYEAASVLLSDATGYALRHWLKQPRTARVYAGIDGTKGALDHNLRKFVDLGCDGCLFYLPVDESTAEAEMEAYLTDIENC